MALLEQDFTEFTQELKTIRDILRWCITKFEYNELFYGHGTDNAWDEAIVLMTHFLKLPFDKLQVVLDAKLTASEKQELYNYISMRVDERIPLPYITNEAWFADLPFYVDERVLIPRSPVAELIKQSFQPWLLLPEDAELNILEIGTGSGCIAIAIADHFLSEGYNITVDASDISDDALAVATMNIEQYGVAENVQLIKSDLFNNIPNKKYNLIISNPPYVDAAEMAALPDEFLHEPQGALAAGVDGLDLVDIMLKKAAQFLTDDGVMIIEVGASQPALEEKYPTVAFTWLDFMHGGEGVFLLTKKQLEELND